MIAGTVPRSAVPRWVTRLILLGVALANIQCLGDFVPPEAPVYDFETADSTITVAAGDIVSPPAVALKVNGKVQTTSVRVEVVGVTDVVTVDTATNRIAILKTGTATVRVRPVNSGLATDTLHVDITLTAIAPKAAISGPDTAYSIGDTLKQVGRATTKADVTLPGVPVTWSVVAPDSGVATFLQIGDTARLIAVKVGDITLRAQVDTGWLTKLVRVRQRVASIVVSPPGDSATPGRLSPTFTAIANDARGRVIPAAPINWTTLNPNIATIGASSGVVTRVNSGQTAVAAQSGTVTGYGLVSVVVPVATPVNLWAPMTSNTTAQLNGVYGTSTSNIFAVGNGGVIRRWNGTSWTTHSNSSVENLSAVWSLSVLTFAVGANGTIRQYDGVTTWNAVTSNTTANLLSIWGNGPNGIHIGGVGRFLSNTTGTFTSQTITGTATSIWGSSSASATAVNGAALALWNYDGTNWTAGATMPGGIPMTVWGLSGSRLYAVGDGGGVRTFNGSGWVQGSTGGGFGAMYGVWGTGPNDVYIVGQNGAIARQGVGGIWQIESSGTTGTLRSIWGLGDDVFIVGDGGTILRGYRGASVTINQAAPTLASLGATVQLTTDVRDASLGVVGSATTFTWASNDTTIAQVSATGLVTARSNGATQVCATAPGGAKGCSNVTVAIPVGPVVTVTVTPPGASLATGTTTFSAVARDANGNAATGKTFTWASSNTGVATASGATLTAVESGQTTVSATVDGVTGYAVLTVATPNVPAVNLWVSDNSGTSQTLRAVWGTGPSLVYAVGDGGVIRSNTGTGWVTSSPSLTSNLDGIWGSASNNVFVGISMLASPRIIRWDGGAWSSSLSTGPGPGGISGVWGVSPKEVYASESGSVYRFNGTDWVPTGVGFQPPQPVYQLWGFSTNDVWAVGNGGLVSRWNGSWWQTVPTGVAAFEGLGVWGTGPNEVFVVGDSTALRWNGTAFASIKNGLPAGVDLTGVSGTSGSDVYASTHGNGTFRFNGTSWSQSDIATEIHWGIHALRNGDVIAVGNNGAIRRGYRGATLAATPAGLTLTAPGATQQMTPALKDAANNGIGGATFTWTTDNPAVVTVTSSGLVTAVAAGSAQVCVQAPGGVQGCTTVTVNVGPPVASITVSPAGTTITGGTTQLTATAKDGSGNTMSGVVFAWTSLNPAVATVNSSGVVTAVSSGQVTIVASSGGATGYALVTVVQAGVTPVNLWLPVLNVNSRLNAVWGASSTSVYAVGDNATVRKFDGTSWVAPAVNPDFTGNFHQLWGTGANDVFAAVGGGMARFDGSAWASMPPATDQRLAVWGSSPKDLFATGVSGKIYRYDGSTWTAMTSNSLERLEAVYGFSATDVFVVGENGTALRYNGTSWTSAASGLPASEALVSIWGSTSNALFGVSDNSGKLYRFNGSAWSEQSVPGTGVLLSVWGSSASEVYAVGGSGRMIRFDGSAWSQQSTGTSEPITGIWGTSGGDVWAVGGSGSSGFVLRGVRGATLALAPASVSLASAGQTQQVTPTLKDASGAALGSAPFTWTSSNESAATVSSTGLVTAVANGSSSVCATGPGGVQSCASVTIGVAPATISVSPNGVSLTGGTTTLTADAKDAGGASIPNTAFVWSSLNGNIATVNSSTGVVTAVASGQATIAATTGGVTGYALITVAIANATPANLWAPMTSGTTNLLNAVWASSASDAWAVGNGGTAVHFDGTSWTTTSTGTTANLSGVWGMLSNPVYAVGLESSAGNTLVVLKYNGTSWQPALSVATDGANPPAIWGSAPNDIYVSSGIGQIRRFDGSSWTLQTTLGTTIGNIWGSASNNIWATGYGCDFLPCSLTGGEIFKYNGTGWSQITSPLSEPIRGLWGTSPFEVFTVGHLVSTNAGYGRRWDGSGWTSQTLNTNDSPQDIWGTSTTDVYIAVRARNPFVHGTVQRFNGTSWSTVSLLGTGTTSSPDAPSIYSVGGTHSGSVWAVGSDGKIMRGVRGAQIAVSPANPNLTAVGNTLQLGASATDASSAAVSGVTFTWSSDNSSVVSINSTTGLATANAIGSASVCANAVGGAQGCTTVTVSPAAATIAVTPAGVTITSGTSTLTATAKDANNNTIAGKAFTWSSLNTNVATVNSSTGVVTPVASGQVAIGASADGVTSYSVITVALDPAQPVNLWAKPTPLTGNTLRSIWIPGPNGGWAVGLNGTSLNWDGTQWLLGNPGTTSSLNGVSGLGSTDITAVGATGVARRFTTSWSGLVGTGNDLYDVWIASPGQTFASGGQGVYSFNGSAWTQPLNTSGNPLFAIWGRAANDVWAAGWVGQFYRYDGTSWNAFSAPNSEFINDIWGTSASNVWVVGSNNTVYRWSGSGWTQMDPGLGSSVNWQGVWGASASDVYVVGYQIGSENGLLARFNGTAWSTITAGTLPALWAVSGSSNGPVHAVGVSGAMVTGYRGATVTVSPAAPTLTALGATQQMTASPKDANNNAIGGVTVSWSSSNQSVATVNATGLVTAVAVGSTNVCATALGGAQGCTTVAVTQSLASIQVTPSGVSITSGTTLTGIAKDANGSTISGVSFLWESLNPSLATVNSSTGAVTAVAAGQAAISATSGSNVTGYALVTVAVPSAPAVNLFARETTPGGSLREIWGANSGAIWAVGSDGPTTGSQGVMVHYNGTSWSNATLTTNPGLTDVAGVSASDAWAVGEGGLLWRWNGSTWSAATSPTSDQLYGVWASGPKDVWAVTHNTNKVFRYNGSTWAEVAHPISAGGSQLLRAVWGSSADDVWVVGEGGALMHWNGSSFSAVTSPAGAENLYDVWGSGPNDVWAVGGTQNVNPVILHYNGSTWSVTSRPGGSDLLTVWGNGPNEVWAAGSFGLLLRYNGSAWTVADSAGVTRGHLHSLWGIPPGPMYASADSGIVVRGYRGASVTVTPATPTLGSFGATQQMTATAKDASNNTISGATFTWSISDETKATVNGSGLVTAVANGTTTACATVPGGAQGCTTLTVDQAASSITVSPSGTSISSGTTTFTATAKDANNNSIAGQTFTWSSLNTNVATVNSSTGVVTPVASGQVAISATADGVTSYGLATVTIPSTTPVNLLVPMASGTTTALTGGMLGFASNDVYVVEGVTQNVLRFNGGSWSNIATGAAFGLNALWGAQSSDLWVTGNGGQMLHYNGSWTPVATGLGVDLSPVWGASPTDVFVAGSAGVIGRYNGSAWSAMSSGTSAAFAGIWGFSRDNVFAIAAENVRRFDGTQWTSSFAPPSVALYGIWGSSPSDVYAVGCDFPGGPSAPGRIYRFDGSSWSLVASTAAGKCVVRVWGTSSSEVYAAGDNGLLMRFDGSSWATLSSGTSEFLRGVWTTTNADVHVAGTGGTILRGIRGATVTLAPATPTLTSLGATQQLAATAKDASANTISGSITYTWSSATPSVATVNSSGVVTAVAIGSSNVCATAAGGVQGCTTVTVAQAVASIAVTPNGVSLGNGTTPLSAAAKDANGVAMSAAFTWSSLNTNIATVDPSTGVVTGVRPGQATIAATAGGVSGYSVATVAIAGGLDLVNLWAKATVPVSSLFEAWGSSASDIHVVGTGGAIYHYNGTAWSQATSSTSLDVYSIWGASASDVLGVGNDVIVRFNGTSWSTILGSETGAMDGVWGVSANDVWAVGSPGRLRHFNGSTWSDTTVGSQQLRRIWGFSSSDIFAVGANGTILHYNGTAWSSMTSGTGMFLTAVWGASNGHVYAVGEGGTILHYSAGNWSAMTSGTSAYLQGIWGSSDGEVYAVGNNGVLLRYNGSTWSTLTSGESGGLLGVAGIAGEPYITGQSGTILRGVRGATVTVTPDSPTLTALGNTQQLSATAKDASNNTITGATFTWSSSDETKATVTSSGVVTAVGNGSTNVCATAAGGAQGCTTVTVSQSTASVVVTPNAITLGTGSTTLTATAKDANGNTISGKTFSWTSHNPKLATVNSSGQATSVASGQAIVSATTDGVSGYSLLHIAISGATPVTLWAGMTSNTNKDMYNIWGTDTTDIFSVGNSGTIMHYDGASWSAMTSNTTDHLFGVWGTSSSNVFAVGYNGRIMRYNGTTWSQMTSGTANNLYRVWGTSPTNIYVVGAGTTVLRYDGTSWSAVSPGVNLNYFALWGTAPDNVYIGGGSLGSGAIVRYNGTSWTQVATTSQPIEGFWGPNASDIHAAADNGLILHYDGNSWSTSTSNTTQHVTGIWGSSASDIYAGLASGVNGFLRYDGSSWTPDTAHNFLGGDRRAWGSPSDVFMAKGGVVQQMIRGYRGATVVLSATNPFMAVGASTTLTATGKTASNTTISGVDFYWTSSNTSVASVGSTTGVVTAIANGTAEIRAIAPGGAFATTTVTVATVASLTVSPSGATNTGSTTPFTATAKDASNNTLITGAVTWSSLNTNVATISSSGVATGVASGQVPVSATLGSFTGYGLLTVAITPSQPINLWASVSTGATGTVSSVWATASNNVWIGTSDGQLIRYNGSSWSVVQTLSGFEFQDIWGAASNDVYAVGSSGKVVRYNGSSWSTVASGLTSNRLLGVWGSAPNDVYAVGDNGTLLSYDGSTWTASQPLSNGNNLMAVWGTAKDNMRLVGWVQTVIRRNGGLTWASEAVSSTKDFYGVWGSSTSDMHLAATTNEMQKFNGTSWAGATTAGSYHNYAVRGTSPTDVYALSGATDGSTGFVHYFNGTSWSSATSPTLPKPMNSIFIGQDFAYVVGNDANVYRGYRGATVTVTPSTPTLTSAGATQQLTATAKDASNNTISGVSFTWTSGDETKATVSASGLVTAVANGTTSVCAMAPGGAQGCTTVTVSIVTFAAAHGSNTTAPNAGIDLLGLTISGTNRLLVCVLGMNGASITSVAVDDGSGGGSQSLAQLGPSYGAPSGGTPTWSTWYVVGATTGSGRRVRATFSGTSFASPVLACVSYSGVHQTTPFGTSTIVDGVSGSAAIQVTSTADGSMPWAHLVSQNDGYSGGTGVTDRQASEANRSSMVDGNTLIANANSHTFNWSYASKFVAKAAMIRPAP